MLVAVFIFVISASLSLAAYAALGITVIEAIVLGLSLLALLGLFNEISVSRAATQQLEKKIEDLTRLIARENQAHNALEERIKIINSLDVGSRLDSLEADLQVLTTVVRQVAESVKELEENWIFSRQNDPSGEDSDSGGAQQPFSPIQHKKARKSSIIPPQRLIDAIHKGQIEVLATDVVTLPQRKLFAYRLMPQLKLDEDEIVSPDQFLRYHDQPQIIALVDFATTQRALEYLRRIREDQPSVRMFVPLAVNKLEIEDYYNEFMSFLASNATFASYVIFEAEFHLFEQANKDQRRLLDSIVAMGYRICLVGLEHLRHDFKDMMDRGVRYLALSAGKILSPSSMAEIHLSDMTDYLARFDMELVVLDVQQEDQILELIEVEVKFATGDYINIPQLLTFE